MANEAYARMHGYTVEELQGKPISKLFAPDFLPQLPKIIQEVQERGFHSFEAPRIRKDGKTFPALVTVSAIKDPNGTMLYEVANVIDISEIKQVESALKKSEERLSMALEASSSGTWDWNIQTGEVITGGEWLKSLGYESSDLEENVNAWKKIIHPDDFLQAQKEMSKHFAKKTKVYESINRIRMKNGNWRWNYDRGRIVEWTTDGKPLRMVGTDTDITTRVLAEKGRKESENRLQAILDHSPGLIYLKDLNGRYLHVNQKFKEVFSLSETEIIGRTDQEVFSPYQASHFQSHDRQVIETQKMLEFEEVTQQSDGLHTSIVNKFPLFNENKEIFAIGGITTDITKRKLVEEALQESQAWISGIVDIADDAVIAIDEAQHITLFNQGAEKIFGYQSDEILGQSLDLLLPPRFSQRHQDGIRSFSQSTSKARIMGERGEVFGLRKDGKEFPAEASISKLKTTKGTTFTVILRDISERKQAQSAIGQLAAIVVSSEDAIIGKTLGGIITSWNQSAERIFGYAAKEVLGHNKSLLLPPDRPTEVTDILTRIQKGEIIHHYETVRRRKNGTLIDVALSVSPVRDFDGNLIGASTIARDITERRKTEEAFRQSERLVNSTMNSLTAQLCVVDDMGQILATNKRWNKFAKDNNGNLKKLGIGNNYFSVCIQASQSGDKSAGKFLNGLKKVLGKYSDEFSFDYECSSPNKIRWFSARVTRFPDPGPIRAVIAHYDITEQKILSQTIQQQNESLEAEVARRTQRIQELEQRRMQVEKLAALSQIAAGIAHEINNPLASISQSLVLLKRAISLTHPHFHYVAKAEDCIDRIAHITKHLYQLYRPSCLEPEPIDLKIPLQTAMEVMNDRAKKHGVRLKMSPISDPAITSVTPGELIQVFCNLIQNAIDASPPDSTIEMSLVTGPDTLSILVADQGEGISPEAAPHIFEPFFTTKQKKIEGGMGLGLSVSHSLIESMSGTLDFSTTIGHGSTFRITLPHTSTHKGGKHDH